MRVWLRGQEFRVCPRQKVCLGNLELADVGKTGLENDHQHRVKVVQSVKHLDGSQCVAHHLCIALGVDLDALAVFVVHDADGLARDDECVRRAETVRHILGEVHFLLHHDHGVFGFLPELADQSHDEQGVSLGGLFHLAVIGCEFLGRVAHLLAQSLAELVLAERMGIRPLSGVLAGGICFCRIETSGRRTGNPPCRR